MTLGISSSKFAEIVAKAKAKREAELNASKASILFVSPPDTTTIDADIIQSTDKYGNSISYNSAQSSFITLAKSGKSSCLIGPAGTGKTTAMKGVVQALIQSPKTGILQNHTHKHLPHGTPGIVICAYTRRATNNIRRNMDESMKSNCITIHKLLEYGPTYFTILNDKGEEKTSMRFEPQRNAENPLPTEISCIIFEESSMIATQLYAEIIAALSHEVQIIFLGDIQQLPPVFGPAILGFKLNELPVVELTEVYRQALESPIIRLAHRILEGKAIPYSELESWNTPGLKFIPWKKQIDADSALGVTEKFFANLFAKGLYNPLDDIILIPFNKQYGTIELNKSIAQNLALKEGKVVWEVIAGFIKHYLSVGDKVLFDREDAVVLEIYPNPGYVGMPAQPESTYLDYWGHNNKPKTSEEILDHDSKMDDIDFLLGQVTAQDDEDRVTQSSHHIKLLMQDSDTEKTLTKAAEVNALLLGYCLTTHKAQGSEWERVFVCYHNSHATMLQREHLYTSVTRAKKELIVICEPDTFTKGVRSQRVKGNTLAEKAEYFRGKQEKGDLQS